MYGKLTTLAGYTLFDAANCAAPSCYLFYISFFLAGAAAKISSFVCCFVGFVGCCRRRLAGSTTWIRSRS